MAKPGKNLDGFVQSALLTWEILAYFAVRQYLLTLLIFEKTPFLKKNEHKEAVTIKPQQFGLLQLGQCFLILSSLGDMGRYCRGQ